MVNKLSNSYSNENINDYIGGLENQIIPTNYPVITNANINNNRTNTETSHINFDALDDISNRMNKICEVLNTIISTFYRLIDNNIYKYNYQEINTCVESLINKMGIAISSTKEMITSFKEGLNKIKQTTYESNNINNERDTKETFQESIKPIRDYLSQVKKSLCETFNIIVKGVQDIYIENYNKSNINNKITREQFESSMINEYPFKAAVLDALTKSPIWYIIMNIGIYIPGSEKRINYLEPIISNTQSNEYDSNIAADILNCFSGNGESSNYNTLDDLENTLKFTLKNFKSGLFTKKINDDDILEYQGGHEDNSKNNTSNNPFSSTPSQLPIEITSNIDEYKEKTQLNIAKLNELSAQFMDYKNLCQKIKTVLMEFINRDASIYSLFQASTKYLLDSTELQPFESTIYFTSNDKIYYQIMLNKIKNDSKYNSQIAQYMPAIQYIRLALDKLFPNKISSTQQTSNDLFSNVTSIDCSSKEIKNKYFNVYFESENIKFIISIIDCLNNLVIKPYVNRTGTNITVFCVINDYESSSNDKTIYKRTVDEEATNLLETVTSLDCQKLNSVNIIDNNNLNEINANINTNISTVKIPFTYIFDRCELSMIPYYIKIAERIKEKQHACMLTFGYSGTGKSVTTMGKYKIINGKTMYTEGILQYALQSLKGAFSVEVLEIYGRALPAYESFNVNGNNGYEGLMKSISWIKIYTNHSSVQSTGIYDPTHDSDKYIEEQYDYFNTNVNGSLIKDPIEIKKYFSERLTNDFIKNNMYHVKEENVMAYLQQFSKNLVDPVEEKRRQLRTIFFTPNNPDSSRSILLYTLAFKIGDDKYTTLTIADFPGKENPISTYINDIPRDISLLKSKILSSYGSQYSSSQIELYLQKFNDIIIGHDTFINLLPFNPFILFGMAPHLNIIVIDEINNYVKRKNISKDKMRSIIKNVFEKELEPKLKIKNCFNMSSNNVIQLIDNGIIPQLYDWLSNPTVNNRNMNLEPPSDETKSILYTAAYYTKQNISNYLIQMPNILRMYYISFIFIELLNSEEFSNNDIIVILLNSINNGLKIRRPEDDIGVFLFNQPDDEKFRYFCTRLNNMFEAYFINEVIAIMIRDTTSISNDNLEQSYFEKDYQGLNLKINDMTNYIVKRLLSTPETDPIILKKVYNTSNIESLITKELKYYNPLIDTTQEINNKGKIYYIINNDTDIYYKESSDDNEYKKLKRKIMNKETSNLYDYSKVISNIKRNNILELLHLPPERTTNNKLAVYILYVVSSVQSDMKCSPANQLLESMIPTLECLILGKCQNTKSSSSKNNNNELTNEEIRLLKQSR